MHSVGDRVEGLPGEFFERAQRRQFVVAREVDLCAVAGREADRVTEASSEQRGTVERERDALAELHGRHVMRDADDRQSQKWLPARTTRARMTSANPVSAK